LGDISNASKHYLHDGRGVIEYANPVEDSPSFMYNPNLKSIKFPKGIKKIASMAFCECFGLNEVYIPEGVTEIGSYAFAHCSGLKEIILPESVVSIGEWAFNDCSSLTSVTIPESVTSIGKGAFNSCTSLTSVTIGNSVTSIGDWAFSNCFSLASITCEALIPPVLESSATIPYNTTIHVPAESVDAYKQETNWCAYADNIQSIQES
jgi:hypothetical protein